MKSPPFDVLILTGFADGIGEVEGEDVGVGADGGLGIEVLSECEFLRVGGDVESTAAFEREGRDVVRIVRREIADVLRIDGNEEEVRALVAGEVVPVAVEEMGEDLRLYLAGGERVIAVLVALVPGGKRIGADGGAIRIDVRREDNGFASRATIWRCLRPSR